jgi:uncharacterized protein with GYD domain
MTRKHNRFRLPGFAGCRTIADTKSNGEEIMPLYIIFVSFTEQGIRNIKDGPKRAKAARELAKKLGVDIKQVYLTSGESDILVVAEAKNSDNIAKFALSLASRGNVRTRTVRAWSESEYFKLVSELP